MSKRIEGMANHVFFGGEEPAEEAPADSLTGLGDVEMDLVLGREEDQIEDEDEELEDEEDTPAGDDESDVDDADEDDPDDPEAGEDDEDPAGADDDEVVEPNASGSLDDPRYLELRDAYNKTQWELQRIKEMQEQARAIAEQDVVEAPETHQIVEYAKQNPLEAFNIAFAHADDEAIVGIVSTVQSEAYASAAEAAVLRDAGDEQGAARLMQDAQQQSILAQRMQFEHNKALHSQAVESMRSELEESIAPHRNDRLTRELEVAATEAFRPFVDEGIDITAHNAGISQYIQTNPQILGQTREDAQEGFRRAVVEVVFGGQDGYIKHLVSQQVAAAQGTKKIDKSRAIAGGTGASARSAPAAKKKTFSEDVSDSLKATKRSSRLADAGADVFKW